MRQPGSDLPPRRLALCARQGEVRVRDPARDAPRLLPLQPVERRLILVGAGHAHALVLERWADDPPSDVDLVVVSDREELLYSGMIPGLVAGEYQRHELAIDVGALARRAGARLVLGSVTEVDAEGRRISVDGSGGAGGSGEGPGPVGPQATVHYDVASLDVGSTVSGLDRPGVRRHAVSPRSVDGLIRRLDDLSSRGSRVSVVVVGGGAAGVELAATVRARLGAAVTLVEQADRLMADYPESVSSRVLRALRRRGVEVRLGVTVSAVEVDAIRLERARPRPPGQPAAGELPAPDQRLRSDLTVWATGAAAHPFLARSGLPVDPDGYVAVRTDLRVVGRDDLFAAGDCAGLVGHDAAKAGVHAVRQAPVLLANLRAAIEGRSSPGPERYEPRRDFLTLLNLGDRTALGTKWGLTLEGRWVRWVKDWIDRRFVARFGE